MTKVKSTEHGISIFLIINVAFATVYLSDYWCNVLISFVSDALAFNSLTTRDENNLICKQRRS